jgi:SAM-dependent methyltransferase
VIEYEQIRRFYDANHAGEDDADEFARGTVETSTPVVKFRNRAEARHLARVLDVGKQADVLDLGGGSGRWSAWFAARCRHVTMVDLAPSLVAAAARNMQRRGLGNVTCLEGSILTPPLPQARRFDVVHIGGVLVYVNDADLPRVRAVVEAHTTAGATLVLREPVDPAGPSTDERPGGYRALFRRPERYAALFAPSFDLVYERVTVSHFVPAGKNTGAFVADLHASRWRRALVARVLPLAGYVDYHLLGLEQRLRRSRWKALLGDPGVVQHFFVFKRRS